MDWRARASRLSTTGMPWLSSMTGSIDESRRRSAITASEVPEQSGGNRPAPSSMRVDFWKPVMPPEEIEALARYGDPDEPLSPGINVWRTDSEARPYRVAHAGAQFSLYAAVHPIEDVPETAEVVADILDRSGNHYSYVLAFPEKMEPS